MHLLGYLFDPEHPAIVAEQLRLRTERVARLRLMTERMAAAGFPVDVDTVFALLPDGGSAGRPHLARALVGAGVVASVDEAFAKLLYTGSPYYVEKVDTPAATAVAMVRAAGGVAVFAHPLARRRGRVVDEQAIAELATAGLAGLEVDHPDHAPADRALLRGLGGGAGPGRHGLERLPRHEQDDADRRGDHGSRPVRGAGRPRERGRRGPRRLIRRESVRSVGESAAADARVGTFWPANVTFGAALSGPSRYIRGPSVPTRAHHPAGPGGCSGRTSVEGWTVGCSWGWTRWIPLSRRGHCCASRPPGSRRGLTARGATG